MGYCAAEVVRLRQGVAEEDHICGRRDGVPEVHKQVALHTVEQKLQDIHNHSKLVVVVLVLEAAHTVVVHMVAVSEVHGRIASMQVALEVLVPYCIPVNFFEQSGVHILSAIRVHALPFPSAPALGE